MIDEAKLKQQFEEVIAKVRRLEARIGAIDEAAKDAQQS